MAELRDVINKIFNEYLIDHKDPNKKSELGKYFKNDIGQILYDAGIVDRSQYIVKGGAGQGNMPDIAYFCILDSSITTSTKRGVYVAYLFSKDLERVYMTLAIGCVDIIDELKPAKAKKYFLKLSEEIREQISSRGFSSEPMIDLGEDLWPTSKCYPYATIFYKEYQKGELPSEEILQSDLKTMMEVYQDYKEKCENKNEQDSTEESKLVESKEIIPKDEIDRIKDYIASKGFFYSDGVIENFYLSLKTKPFVILAGISGTGKTRLVQLFAESVGATSEEGNGRYMMVPVRPDWSDSSDLLGHLDLNGNFIPGDILKFIKTATEDLNHPYFLCLDEMNLARVEYYLSDFLSVMETRDFHNGSIETKPLVPISYYGRDNEAASKYGEICLPENLYIIGTVNMDETTFQFSKKVLDRANTIEFSDVNLNLEMEMITSEQNIQVKDLNNDFLKTKYLLLTQCVEGHEEIVKKYCDQLQEINEILQEANAQIGYRIRDEIVFYLINNAETKLIDDNEAMDNEIMQKILPRIQGSNSAIKTVLCKLFELCCPEFKEDLSDTFDVGDHMINLLQGNDNCIYKKSAEKIAFMVRRFEEDGFTSYWF